jgi:acyl-CoA synthetase (AMP-forming)/AMP-acid ligase II
LTVGTRVLAVDADRLEAGVAVDAGQGDPVRDMVSVGSPAADHDIVVVDPELETPLPDRSVGEIWIAGPSLASGYWRNEEATAAAFDAWLPDGRGPFLRTGDLGFLADGDLFVAGRRKELMIVRGRNVFPHDVEDVVQHLDPRLRAGCGAAFSIETPDGELVVIVQETGEADADELQQMLGIIRAGVSERLALRLEAIVLIEPKTIPKTSSGKLRRFSCRDAYRNDELSPLAEWSRLATSAVGL